jgi:hypothetical protein
MMVLVSSVLLLMLAVPWAYGQTASSGTSKPAANDDQWHFSVAPYLWAVNIDSKVTVGNYDASSTVTFSDLLRNLQGAGQVHAEAQKGRFGFFLDPTYMKIRGDGTFTRVRDASLPLPPTRDLTLTLEMWLVEFGGFYQVGKWPINGNSGQKITVDILGGGRYWNLYGDLDTTSRINPSRRDDWVDPIIGARVTADLTKKLVVNLRGDVGGFGVGSDISWNGVLTFGYRFTPSITAMLGYRLLYVDYKGGSSRARYEETMYGPMAGVAFTF